MSQTRKSHDEMPHEPVEPGPDGLPTPGEYQSLVARAQKGSARARRELRTLHDRHPGTWQAIGVLDQFVNAHRIAQAAGASSTLQEAIHQRLAEQCAALCRGPGDPLEEMLADRVLTAWLEVALRQIGAAQAQDEPTARLHLRRLTEAWRQFQDAARALRQFQSGPSGPEAEPPALPVVP